MGRAYAVELSELPRTFARVRSMPEYELRALFGLVRHLAGCSALFVGSGGTLSLAELAAEIHMASGNDAQAMTPLRYARWGARTPSAVVLFSSRARHPDVRVAAAAGRAGRARTVTLVTQVRAADLAPGLLGQLDHVVTLPKTSDDGFLATNGLLAMATAWVRATVEEPLPASLPLDVDHVAKPADGATSYLLLHSADQTVAALDLESRLSESGVAPVQVTDLRNVAHGRHSGVAANRERTRVVGFFGPSSSDLARRTVSQLGVVDESVFLVSEFEGAIGSLDGLVGSMRLFGAMARGRDTDPGNPRVAAAGRRLYHLGWRGSASRAAVEQPVLRKLRAAGLAVPDGRPTYLAAEKAFLEACEDTTVGGVVVDYDGTVVTTEGRRAAPDESVRTALLRILKVGGRVAFASGRGGSLREGLVEWVPRDLWPQVVVGAYNGGTVARLDEEPPPRQTPGREMSEAGRAITKAVRGLGWTCTVRPSQVTLEPDGPGPRQARETVLAAVVPVLARLGEPRLRAVLSGHTVDLIPDGTSKTAVIEAMGLTPATVLAVGDQGHPGGNDFGLLAAVPLGLSVGSVSADPLRCWNLGRASEEGPALLTRYLDSLVVTGDSLAFRWRAGREA